MPATFSNGPEQRIECGRIQVRLALALAWASISAAALAAEPYQPNSPDDIVAELSDAVVILAAQARKAAPSTPVRGKAPNTQLLMQSVYSSYQLARRNNDARAYGHVLSVLESWPASQQMPDLARLIKASVLQHNHRFTEALAELQQMDPESARQALPQQAQINITLGDYTAAARLCDRLDRLGDSFSALNCRTQVQGLSGNAEPALQRITGALREQPLNRLQTVELRISAAGIASRLGQVETAIEHYGAGLALAPDNVYLLVNFSDLLLAAGHAQRVVELLRGRANLNREIELQMLYARALRQTQQTAEFDQVHGQIAAAIAAMSQRGADRPHKLLAIYAVHFGADRNIALAEAAENWQVQKEPSDLRLLADAAAAAQDLTGLTRVAEWMRKSGLQDWRLTETLQGAARQTAALEQGAQQQ